MTQPADSFATKARACQSTSALLAILVVLAVSACSGTAGEKAAPQNPAPTTSPSTSPSGPGLSTATTPQTTATDVVAGPVTFRDASREITLPQPAKKIVVLDWVTAEDVLALGVEPVGLADPPGYRTYVGAPPQPSDQVTDVGTRQEPSLERIRALQPDLIIGPTDTMAPVRDQLEAIAPTALYNAYDPAHKQLDEMRSTFTQIGAATGKQGTAQKVLAELDAHIASTKTKVGALPAESRRVALVQGYLNGNVPVMRMFTNDSMAIQLFQAAGLTNTWTEPGDNYGFTTTDIEGMTRLTDGYVLYTATEEQLSSTGIKDNPLFKTWPPATAGHLSPLGEDAWTFGGPLSARLLLDRAVSNLSQTAPAPAS